MKEGTKRLIVIGVPSGERLTDETLRNQADFALRSMDHQGLSKVTEVVVGTNDELPLGHAFVKVIDYGDNGTEPYSTEFTMTRDAS